ncbi:MAG: dihydroorotase [Bacillota bacterium]|nr:dihydroorotase [Bacillota bacterium]
MKGCNVNMNLKNLNIFQNGKIEKGNLSIAGSIISDIGPNHSMIESDSDIFFADSAYAFPGFIDVHVHLREPGYSYKETIETGTMAAAHGGYTAVCTMPNLNPVPDSVENLKVQLDIIEKTARVAVYPFGSISKGEKGVELSDMEELADYVVGYSDDGICVQSHHLMEEAMKKAKALGKIVAAHCECNSLADGGYIHDGKYAKKHGHKGLSSESEYKAIERDIELARKTGAHYHVCHLSCKESVEIVRRAKAEGLNVTCEVAAHHVCLDDSMLKEDGIYKVYPPIRSLEDRLAVIEGIVDGTVDMIASDHAPHTEEEKSKGLKDSAKGIVGLETTFRVLHSKLVRTKLVSLERLIDLVYTNPRKIFKVGAPFEKGEEATFTIFDLESEHKVEGKGFFSKTKFTPFEGMTVYARCLMTVYKGEIVYLDESLKK